MIENSMAQPSDLRHPGNPRCPTPWMWDLNITIRGMELYVLGSGYEIEHAYAFDDWDLKDLLTSADEETILEAVREQGEG